MNWSRFNCKFITSSLAGYDTSRYLKWPRHLALHTGESWLKCSIHPCNTSIGNLCECKPLLPALQHGYSGHNFASRLSPSRSVRVREVKLAFLGRTGVRTGVGVIIILICDISLTSDQTGVLLKWTKLDT